VAKGASAVKQKAPGDGLWEGGDLQFILEAGTLTIDRLIEILQWS
jgi:hypothetical protein